MINVAQENIYKLNYKFKTNKKMEAIVSILVIVFAVGMVLYVEIFMYRKPLTEKEISDYQVTLNKISESLKNDHGVESSYDSKTQLLDIRKQEKSSVLVLAGVAIGLCFVVLVFTGILSLTNIGIMCVSAVVLIIHAIIKMAESKKVAISLVVFILALGTLAKFLFDKAMEMSPYAYLYCCAIILLIGAFNLFGGMILKRA